MPKTKLFLTLGVPVLLLLIFCARRPFAHMAVHGQIINGKTNQPYQGIELSLWVGCDPSICGHGNRYGTTNTNENGEFKIKSNAQWKGNKYYLSISTGKTVEFSASKNQNVDLGIIVVK